METKPKVKLNFKAQFCQICEVHKDFVSRTRIQCCLGATLPDIMEIADVIHL